MRRFKTLIGAVLTLAVAAASVLRVHSQGKTIDWRYFGGDKGFTRYSPAGRSFETASQLKSSFH